MIKKNYGSQLWCYVCQGQRQGLTRNEIIIGDDDTKRSYWLHDVCIDEIVTTYIIEHQHRDQINTERMENS